MPKNKKLLIIDDYAPLLEEVKEYLEMEGYTVETAKNGAEGFQKAITTKPEMILCDILMPEMDGYEVFKSISQIPFLSSIPFIFLTARATPDDYRKGLELGVDDYLTKPFTLDKLVATIEKRFQKIDKYKSVKENVIDFFFSNPLLALIIVKDGKVTFINDKAKEVSGYSIKEMNKLNLKDAIVGDINPLKNEINLLISGVHKSFENSTFIINKNKKTLEVKFYISTIPYEGDTAIIVGFIESNSNDKNEKTYSVDIDNFIQFLENNNKKEISNEFKLLYDNMLAEEETKTKIEKRKIKISKREQEILEFICKGNTNKDIAEQLFLSIRTVDNHRANLITKLGVKNTAELVAFAIKNGLIKF